MNKAEFYKVVRSKLGSLNQTQTDGFEAVLKALDGLPLSWQAYGLATAWHETAHTMKPVREGLNVSDEYRQKHFRYYPYYGRGYVQLTWRLNYAKADLELSEAGVIKKGELTGNLDVAMKEDVAAFILRQGMLEGWFTGKKFSSYLPEKGVATREQYIQARRIINILDKAELIETYAQAFEKALREGGVE